MNLPKIDFKNLLTFEKLLLISALFVASIAALFSVIGIGMLFSGAAVSSMVMATSLEIGKLAAVTFIYRYWEKTTKLLRGYLATAIFILVVITSAGVFGWLSSAYQSSALQYKAAQEQVETIDAQKKIQQSQMELSNNRIASLLASRNDQEKRMNETMNSPVLSRNPTAMRQLMDQNISLIKSTDAEIAVEKTTYTELSKKSSELDKQVLDIKTASSKTKDIITFKFVAEELGWELNKTVKWFIMFIIVVFDPLAVSLILAYNVVVADRKKKEDAIPTISLPILSEPEVPVEKVIESASVPVDVIDEAPLQATPSISLPEPVQVPAPVVETPIVEKVVVQPTPPEVVKPIKPSQDTGMRPYEYSSVLRDR